MIEADGDAGRAEFSVMAAQAAIATCAETVDQALRPSR